MKGITADVTIEDCRKEFINVTELRQQIYSLSRDTVEHLKLINYLYDLVNSQVSVELAWRHRDYPKGKPDQKGKHYDKFLEAFEEYKQAKTIYFQLIKEYRAERR